MFFSSRAGEHTEQRELWMFEMLDGSVKLRIRGSRTENRHVQAVYVSDGYLVVEVRGKKIVSRFKDEDYYTDIILFFGAIFASPEHRATRSDFLVWSLAHCDGVTENLFKKMAPDLPQLVEEAMFGPNMDFVVNYLTYSSNPSRLLTQIALMRDNGEYWTLFRALQYKHGIPDDSSTYLRQSGGVERVLAALIQLDRKSILELGKLLARVFPRVEDINERTLTERFMKNPEAIAIFRNAPFWSTTTALSMRMALALDSDRPHFARIAFTTCLWLKSVISPMLERGGHDKDVGVAVQKLANTLIAAPKPGETKRVNNYIKSWYMWVDETVLPTVPSTKKVKLNLEPDYLRSVPGMEGVNKLNKNGLICRFLSIANKPTIQRMYQEMFGDWKTTGGRVGQHFNAWPTELKDARFVAERSLIAYLMQRKQSFKFDDAFANIEEELLNALKALSLNRRPRRHHRTHRW